MKLWEIFRFEVTYQLRRPWPWLAFAILVVFSAVNTRDGMSPVTLPQDFILNSPFIIASVSVFSCLIWLLVASALAGEAGARDVQSGMYPLTYTTPIRKVEYLGGRFLAAFLLNALVLLGVQVGSLLGVYAGGVDPVIIGPFRPAAYLAAYGFIALPNAFTATTIQFAIALRSGRSMASYAGSVVLFFFTFPVPLFLYIALGQPELALLMDPIGMFAIMNEMMTEWTIVEKNVRMFTLEGPMLANRLLWFGISVVTLTVVFLRFSRTHRTITDPLAWVRALPSAALRAVPWRPHTQPSGGRRAERASGNVQMLASPGLACPAIAVPQVPLSFGLAIRGRQMISTARSSFQMIATSLPGLFLLVGFPLFAGLVLFVESEHWGVPLLPRTGYVLAKHLTAPLTAFSDYRVFVPLLIIYFAGELVWRERDVQLSESIDATSVPEWVLFLGKFLGLGLVLAALMVSLGMVSVLSQTLMGYQDFQIALYLQILFGLQLPEYLLFAILAFLVHVVVNQKHVAMLVALAAYLCIVFAPWLGIEHNLLIYGAGPTWSYTDIRGFGSSVGPWLWFKFYWAIWALLLALAAWLLWVRGHESELKMRLRLARRRVTPATASLGAMGVGLVLALGGFIFYNTNVLNEHITAGELVQRRADYERRYGQYEGIPQPQRAATTLDIEIYPDRGAATIHGSYRLENRDDVPIDAVHVEPAFYVETDVTFDRDVRHVLADDALGHHIYALAEPLQPGDSLTLSFEVRFEPRGFSNSGTSPAIVENGSYFTDGALPVIGYQPMRELWSADDRRQQALPRQVTLPPPSDIDPTVAAGGAGTFDAIIGTDANQVAVAPGELRRTWSEAGRRYFHYVSDVPISGMEVFFSADYVTHREHWKDVDVQIFLHPDHAAHLDRVLRSVRASLDYYSAQFGPYPYPFLQVVEQPGNFFGMGVDGSGVVTGGEGFFLLDPQREGFDVIFEVVAHEMAHQWWGIQLKPAVAEGAGVISESLAWYSAMQLVKHEKDREALRQFMGFMRQPSPWPPINTGLPLLRAMDPWANYRKGPYAMHALSEYVGEERVNAALHTLVEKKGSSLATTLDLYRELQSVTPDTHKPLLRDLFEVNTVWTFDTTQARAVQTEGGTWKVTLEVAARKVVTESEGGFTEVPLTERVEIGIFAPSPPGDILGEPLYLQKHNIRAGTQTISVDVPEMPDRGGIDPYNLLDWEEGDNIVPIEIEGVTAGP